MYFYPKRDQAIRSLPDFYPDYRSGISPQIIQNLSGQCSGISQKFAPFLSGHGSGLRGSFGGSCLFTQLSWYFTGLRFPCSPELRPLFCISFFFSKEKDYIYIVCFELHKYISFWTLGNLEQSDQLPESVVPRISLFFFFGCLSQDKRFIIILFLINLTPSDVILLFFTQLFVEKVYFWTSQVCNHLPLPWYWVTDKKKEFSHSSGLCSFANKMVPVMVPIS